MPADDRGHTNDNDNNTANIRMRLNAELNEAQALLTTRKGIHTASSTLCYSNIRVHSTAHVRWQVRELSLDQCAISHDRRL